MSTWKELFDRAEAHDVSQSAIREELERRRAAGEDEGENEDDRGVDDG